MYTNNYWNNKRFDKVIAKIKRCSFFLLHSVDGSTSWNTVSSDLTDTSTFRNESVLFDRAYNCLLVSLIDVSYSGALQISR